MQTLTSSSASFAVGCPEANAIVYAIASEATTIGEGLGNNAIDSPGDLYEIGCRCDRLAALADVAQQLKWRQHHGCHGHADDPLPLKADITTVLDLAMILDRLVDEYERCEGEKYPVDPTKFAAARATLAAVVAEQSGEAGRS